MYKNTNKLGTIVLLIVLLVCSGLGIAAFTMSFTKKCGEGFQSRTICGDDNTIDPNLFEKHREGEKG